MRVLIDTNILLAILPKKSKERWLFQMLRKNEISLILSNEIITEYEEKIAWFYSKYFSDIVLEEIQNLPLTEFFEVHFKWQLIQLDQDDNKFVDVAIASNADMIITNDKHFKVLKEYEFPKVNAVTLDEFKKYFYDIN